MKKILFLVFAAFAAVNTFGQKTTVQHDYQESSARNLEPNQMVIAMPLMADLKVISGRIRYTETEAFKNINVSEFIKEAGEKAFIRNLVEWKKIALSQATKSANADLIIGATIDIATNSRNTLEITVSGYPAVYANFRNPTASDISVVTLMQKYNDRSRNEEVLYTPTVTGNTKIKVEGE